MQFTSCYLRFNKVFQKSKIVNYILFKNVEGKIGMIFSLYAMLLQIILIIYFGRELDELRGLGLLKDNKACHC